MTGLFITLEGGEGAGKSTHARLLATWLAQQGHPVLLTREPGGAPGAETLRTLLLSGQHDWSAEAETLLHFAARAEHVARTIRPALEAGLTVICDRFADSTMAYQGYGQGANRDTIASLTALLGLTPDLTLVLDVSEATARARLARRNLPADRYDRLGPHFHAQVAAGFRAIATAPHCRLVPADADVATVQAALQTVVQGAYKRSPPGRGQGEGISARTIRRLQAPHPGPLPEGEGEAHPEGQQHDHG